MTISTESAAKPIQTPPVVARDEWDKVEARWAEVEARMPQLKAELRDGGQNLRAALDMVTEEISSRYERIRKLF